MIPGPAPHSLPRPMAPPRRVGTLRYEWQTAHPPVWGRSYFAQVNESLVLNVHRIKPESPTWEWLIVGFDLRSTEHPVIVQMGQAGTMKEAKLLAESRVPTDTPMIGQQPVWPMVNNEEVPF